jgi:hypothetical protein
VVQPAGGHGGIEFSADGQSLTKPTNKVELAFYLEVFEGRANPNKVSGIRNVFPQPTQASRLTRGGQRFDLFEESSYQAAPLIR